MSTGTEQLYFRNVSVCTLCFVAESGFMEKAGVLNICSIHWKSAIGVSMEVAYICC